jgi:hypothetical protein
MGSNGQEQTLFGPPVISPGSVAPPQDPHLNGRGLRCETIEHGGEYPRYEAKAIKVTDANGRSCIYVSISQDGKVVDSQGYTLDLEDE